MEDAIEILGRLANFVNETHDGSTHQVNFASDFSPRKFRIELLEQTQHVDFGEWH